MEEGAGNAGGDGDEIALPGEDFDLAGTGEFGEINGASVADAGDGGFVGGDAGKLRQELARVDEERVDDFAERNSRFLTERSARFGMTRIDSRFLHCASLSLRESEASVGMTGFLDEAFDFFQPVGLGDREFGNRGAAEGFEMGSAAKLLAEVVGDGTHVGSGGDAGAEAGAIRVECENGEFFYFYLDRFEDHFLLFAGEFIGGDALDFFGREWGRGLLDYALEFRGEELESFQVEICGRGWTDGGVGPSMVRDRFAVGVVGVSGEAETDGAFVGFFGVHVELGEASEAAGDEREDAGGERVEGAEVSDGALAEDAAHAVDDVVRRPSGGLVDDEDAIHEGIGRLSDRAIWRLKISRYKYLV